MNVQADANRGRILLKEWAAGVGRKEDALLLQDLIALLKETTDPNEIAQCIKAAYHVGKYSLLDGRVAGL